MSVYKQVRKTWLKQLTKEQRKQFKGYVQDVADEMLEAYAETIRLNGKTSKNVSSCFTIADTNMDLRIHIETDSRYIEHFVKSRLPIPKNPEHH